jgi:Na+/phosphate symporter
MDYNFFASRLPNSTVIDVYCDLERIGSILYRANGYGFKIKDTSIIFIPEKLLQLAEFVNDVVDNILSPNEEQPDHEDTVEFFYDN